MRIFIVFYYFIRSLILRGPINSFLLVRDNIRFEKEYGIKTTRFKKSASKEFFHYQGASYRVLNRIFETLPLETKSWDFVDIGSGLGRVAFVAENKGFNTITGIELDADLVIKAKENIGLYKNKRKSSQIHFIQANAINHQYTTKATVCFLFNPFNEKILEMVLTKISTGLINPVLFVYMNPLYPKPFERKGCTKLHTLKTGFYTEAILFKLNPK